MTAMRLSCFTLCSRVRHWDRLWSSPIKGEGEYGCFGLVVSPAPPLWIADQVRNDGGVVPDRPYPVDSRLRGNDGERDYGGFAGLGRCWGIVFTLTFDSSPIKGEGVWLVGLACCCPAHPATLWIPAYAGMTVRGGNEGDEVRE